MPLPLPFHVHVDFPVPGGDLASAAVELLTGEEDGEIHLDLVLADRDDDGNLEIEVKWNLPGTSLDSGPEAKKAEMPTAVLMDGAEEAVDLLLSAMGVPSPLAGLKLFRNGASAALGAIRGVIAIFG